MADDDTLLGVTSTVTALGETQLPPRPAATGEISGWSSGSRYARVGVLGRGGMGIVDQVWDGDLMRDLAIKRIRPELRDDPGMVAQFLWEARVGAYLDHPNIIPVHDLGTSAEGPYFTMKRASGNSLAHWLDQLRLGEPSAVEQMPLARRLRIMHQICQAIGFAHARGVLHRDLKPANVLIGEHNEVLVTDWGLAIPLPGNAGEELRRVMPSGIDQLSAGTPLYMSPEQERGDPLDQRSDVYTLGIMLYELASLRHPRAGLERTAPPRPIQEVWPAVPRSLAAVIEHAMEPDPANRYATIPELIVDLERLFDGQMPLAQNASAAARLVQFYMARDPAMSTLRVSDIDMWIASGWLAGFAMGLTGAFWIDAWWSIVPFVLSIVVAIRPTRRYLEARRGARRNPISPALLADPQGASESRKRSSLSSP